MVMLSFQNHNDAMQRFSYGGHRRPQIFLMYFTKSGKLFGVFKYFNTFSKY